ncbi:MAG: sigma-70 family RNA polymerase sigma factor [Verrucomicrobiota bacterium]
MSDDAHLISRSLDGDLDAYSQLVKGYQESVRACLAVRLQDVTAADDLAQKAFVIAYEKLAQFDVSRSFGPWVRSIALNCLKNHLRKKVPIALGCRERLDALIEGQIDLRYPVTEDAAREQLDALSLCLKELGGEHRELIEKRYFKGEPIAALSKTLNLAHSTVTMRLHRLRESLRTCIEQRLEEVR